MNMEVVLRIAPETYLKRCIVGGYDLARDYPGMENAMLLCVTEMNSKAEIDALVAELRTLA